MKAGTAICVAAAAAVMAAGSGAFAIALAQAPQGAGQGAARPAGVQVVKRPYDMKAISAQPTLPDDAYRGRTIWQQRCAYCHDGVGQPSYQTFGPWLGAETLTKYGEEGVRAFIAAGTERMRGFQYALKPAQVNDLIAFIKTIAPTTKPTPDQLAGRGPGGAVSND